MISPIFCRKNFTTFEWTQQRRSVKRWKLSEQNFENFTIRRLFFFEKTQKLLTKFPGLATSGRHNSAMITDRRKFTSKLTLYGMSSFHFYRWNQFIVIPLDYTLRTKQVPTQIFDNVWRPMLRIKTNSTLQCWCGLASDTLKKSKLNWKLKISNMADNAGITQSQARDAGYRRMQELNRLCVIK